MINIKLNNYLSDSTSYKSLILTSRLSCFLNTVSLENSFFANNCPHFFSKCFGMSLFLCVFFFTSHFLSLPTPLRQRARGSKHIGADVLLPLPNVQYTSYCLSIQLGNDSFSPASWGWNTPDDVRKRQYSGHANVPGGPTVPHPVYQFNGGIR